MYLAGDEVEEIKLSLTETDRDVSNINERNNDKYIYNVINVWIRHF